MTARGVEGAKASIALSTMAPSVRRTRTRAPSRATRAVPSTSGQPSSTAATSGLGRKILAMASRGLGASRGAADAANGGGASESRPSCPVPPHRPPLDLPGFVGSADRDDVTQRDHLVPVRWAGRAVATKTPRRASRGRRGGRRSRPPATNRRQRDGRGAATRGPARGSRLSCRCAGRTPPACPEPSERRGDPAPTRMSPTGNGEVNTGDAAPSHVSERQRWGPMAKRKPPPNRSGKGDDAAGIGGQPAGSRPQDAVRPRRETQATHRRAHAPSRPRLPTSSPRRRRLETQRFPGRPREPSDLRPGARRPGSRSAAAHGAGRGSAGSGAWRAAGKPAAMIVPSATQSGTTARPDNLTRGS